MKLFDMDADMALKLCTIQEFLVGTKQKYPA
jgi:hypothetical protein